MEAPTAAVADVDATSRSTSTMRPKLHGRAFYEAIGSPKHILAPMVDQSEFVCTLS
jgi:tRNA-dihydrouridine synthase 1